MSTHSDATKGTHPNLIKDPEGIHRQLYRAMVDLAAGADKAHAAARLLYGEVRHDKTKVLSEIMAHVEASVRFADASLADARAAFASLKEHTGCSGACEKP